MKGGRPVLKQHLDYRLGMCFLLCFVVCTLFLIAPQSAHACSCGEPSIQTRFENASTVFMGSVTKKDDQGGNWFRVEKVWKGDLSEPYVVGGYFGMCGTEFEYDQSYIVYTYQHDGIERTDLCSGNKLVADASKEVQVLQSLSDPEGSQRALYLVAALLLVSSTVATILYIRKHPKL